MERKKKASNYFLLGAAADVCHLHHFLIFFFPISTSPLGGRRPLAPARKGRRKKIQTKTEQETKKQGARGGAQESNGKKAVAQVATACGIWCLWYLFGFFFC
jgi:hypothetical protein